jgi:hypothetical protein
MIHKDFSDVLHPHGFICRGAIALHQMIQLNLVGLWLWSGMLGFKCGRPLRDHLIFLNKTLWILGHAGLRTRLHPRLKLKLYFLSMACRTIRSNNGPSGRSRFSHRPSGPSSTQYMDCGMHTGRRLFLIIVEICQRLKKHYHPVKVALINRALPHARWGRLSRIIIMCQLVSII